MAKNVDHIQHIKSNVVLETGKPKLPQPSALVEGELAINYAEGVETISIKNSSGDVVTFSSDNYYTEQKLGSGFTGENSGVTVTEALENVEITVDQVIDSGTSASTNAVSTKAVVDKLIEDEQVWAISLNELNNKKFGYANFDSSDNTLYFYKDSDEASSGGPISTVDLSSFSIDIDQVIDSGTSASTDAVSTSAVYDFVTSYTPSITVDQVLDDTTSASTNPVSSKAVYDAVTDNELVWTNAYVALSGAVSAHTANTEIHVTATDKARWDSSSLWVSGTGENAIVQKNGGNTASGKLSVAMGSGTTASGDYSVAEGLNTIASGMYSHSEGDHTTASGQSSHAEGESTTASGRSSHAEGYITQAAGPNAHAEGSSTKADGTSSHAEGSGTLASGDLSHAEGQGTKANGGVSHAEGRETTASGTYSHAEGDGTTASGQSSHAEGSQTTANNKSEHASGQYNVSSTASTTFGDSGNTLFSVGNGTADDARHNAFEIRQNGDIYIVSGNSDIKLQDYIGSVETVTAITPSNSGSTEPIATKVVAENELTVTNALTDLDERKLDASAYTPVNESSGITAMTGYAMAASGTPISTSDTLNAAIGKLEKMIDELKDYIEQKEFAIAAAITDLDNRLKALE